MQDSHITLAHGNGGRYMRELIQDLFARHLGNPLLDVHADATGLPDIDAEVVITTDGFTVQPLEFPGGDIGSLAIHGTTNDLAVAGARPLYLTLNAFIEEGMAVEVLERIIANMAEAARHVGVDIVAGDTKVLPRGEGGGIYLATTGVGARRRDLKLGMDRIQAGDVVLVSGSVGDHGISVMLAREQFGLRGDLQSDAGSVLPLTEALLDLKGLRFMRDPTRGGLASVAHEMIQASGLGLRLHHPSIPISEPVQSVCDMLGYDPMYLACEGRVVAVVAERQADEVLSRWQGHASGNGAAIIGHFSDQTDRVILETELGGERFLEELEDDPLPRIC